MAISKTLTMDSMLARIDSVFTQAQDVPRRCASLKYSLREVLIAGLADFVFKFSSLLQFETYWKGRDMKLDNLGRLFGIEEVLSDETMRSCLDVINPKFLTRVFRLLLSVVQRTRLLRRYFLVGNQYYLLAIDGTGLYSTKTISCSTCCVKKRRSADEYYHRMVQGALVHPDHRFVLMPSSPEFICREDGANKNDREMKALHRYLLRFRREHPHLKVIVILDGRFPHQPIVRLLDGMDTFLLPIMVALISSKKEGRYPWKIL